MKRNSEQSKGSKDTKENAKKARIEANKGEFSGQSTQNISERVNLSETELNQEIVEVLESDVGEEAARKKKVRTSYVWQHFDIRFSDDKTTEYAHCKHCADRKYKLSGRANGGTGNLNNHLKTKHPEKLPEKKKPEDEKFIFSQERYREALLKWIVVSGQPFSECEMDSFLEMIETLNPDAVTISKETVKRDIMKKFDALFNEIKMKLCKSPAKFSFTLDAWTSKNCLPFMAIRAHWINADWEYDTVLLDFCYIEGKHDGLNFSKIFLDCLGRYEIPLDKVLAVTIDNVSSNDTFMSCLEKHGIKSGTSISSSGNRVRCMPHILNLAVQDILSSLKIPVNQEEDVYANLDEEENDGDEDIETNDVDVEDENDEEEILQENQFTVAKLRKLIFKIRKSTQKRQKLRELCIIHKIQPLVPIIDVATRWNSTYAMIERATYLKTPLRNLCLNETSLHKFLTTDAEWSEINSLKELLQKFDRSTNLMSIERHPTICSYLPTLNWLIESLESFVDENTGVLAEAAANGLEKLKKYENELRLCSSKLPYVAVFLNPSLKMSYFKEHGYKKPLIRDIQKTICDLFETTYGTESTNQTSNSEEEESDAFFEFMHKRAVNREPKEFQKYLNFPLSAPKVNLLEYWRSQKDEFPNLSNMARDHLAVQSSAVAVERDFSDGADLVTATRCSLKPQTIRACMCLKSWIKYLNL